MVPNSGVVERLMEHDLIIVFPHHDEIERLHHIIIHELSNNIFTEESKQFYINVIQRLCDEQQVQGVILGCTGKLPCFYFFI
jgi:aspartate racemase